MRWFLNIAPLPYLSAAAALDIKHQKVSVRMALAAGAIAVALQLLWQRQHISWMLGILPGAALLAAAWVSREAIGFGDGCALLVTGLYLGFRPGVSILMTALFLTFPVSLFYLVCKKADRRKTLPFIPFLLAGYLIWLILTGGEI